jgi:hypothetical protein
VHHHHAVLPQGIELVDRHGDHLRARLGGHERLRRAEDERRRHAHAVARQATDGDHRVVDERHLDDDVVAELRQLAPVAVDVARVDRGDAHGDRQGHGAADLLEMLPHLAVARALGGEERGRGDDPVGEAVVHGPPDVGRRRGGEVDLHAGSR